MEIKYKIKIKERRGPDSEPKWGILKYLFVEIFTETSEIDQVQRRMNVESNDTCRRHLRSKIGVWHKAWNILIKNQQWVVLNTRQTLHSPHSTSNHPPNHYCQISFLPKRWYSCQASQGIWSMPKAPQTGRSCVHP